MRIITTMLVSIWGLSVLSQSLPDTVRVPLIKLHEPLTYTPAYWMEGTPQCIYDQSDSTHVLAVHAKLQNGIPLTIDFSRPDSVTYRFSSEYSEITVPVDSMRIYRKRSRGEAEGPVPTWCIGTSRKDNVDFSVWITPDGVVGLPEGPTKFIEEFLIYAMVGDKYAGMIYTPDGPFSLTVHRSAEDPGLELPSPIFLPDGKYEDFSGYVPQVIYGIENSRKRALGSTVKLGAEDFYLIDSITDDFREVILTRSCNRSKGIRAGDEALAELKPFMDLATAQGKLLLIDFWGTWCRPCIKALPKLKEIEEKYADRLVVLSVIRDSEENFKKGGEILDKHGLTGERRFCKNEPLVDLLNVQAFPTYILLDKDGLIVMQGSSAKALDWLENQL